MPVNTPSEVVDPTAAVTAAENEASCLDILVCGTCQNVFHFVEEFSEHKIKNDCKKIDKSSLNLQNNKKPRLWAFLIWKNSQQQAADQRASWELYQKWTHMPESQQQSWITAGRNIRTFINMSHARELNKSDFSMKDSDQELVDDIEEDFVVEKIVGKRYNHKKKKIEYLLKWEGYPPEQNTWEPLSNLTTCKSLLEEYEKTAALNEKNSNLKLSGLLKRDNTPPQVKLLNTNLSKPSGILPNKYPYAEKSKDSLTPTLQTQRKIVPVTPLSNSLTQNKISTPLLTTRTEVNKSLETNKTINNSINSNNDTCNDTNKLTHSILNSTPLKKRIISNSDDSTSSILSPEGQNTDGSKADQSKEWCITIDDDTPQKRPMEKNENLTESAKRLKLETKEEVPKIDDAIDQPKSGIFKKSESRDKYPFIANAFGKSKENSESKSDDTKNENLRGLLKIDHSQSPELVSGIYKMTSSTKGTAKIDLLNGEKSLSAILLTLPGPKGGVLVLSNRFDLSKIVKPKNTSLEKQAVNTTKIESTSFRGIFPKGKVTDDGNKIIKPDFHSKTVNTFDNTKKPLNSSLRKALGCSVPRGKGRTSINSPTGISRFKSNYMKSYGDGLADNSASRLGDGDNFLLEFCDYDNSDLEDYSLPDDFPEELDMEPLSPSRPLTLDPETGKRLMRAEGEPTPQPTPEPSPEPSPVPSPVPTHVICKEENDALTVNENLILKTDDTGEGETFAEINGNTYKVTNAGQVGLLQNTTYTQDGELKSIAVASGLTDEEVADNSNMLTITGDDGLVYQVANAKLEGDTIVVASNEDEQQCVFVTEDGHQVMQRTNEDGSTVLTLESAYADAVAQLVPNQVNILPDGSQLYVKQEENGQVELVQIQGSEMVEPETTEQEETQATETADDNSGQVVAQLIEAGEPAPGGGPRRVVLLLPDGNIMVTEVDEEQFAALELEK